MEITKDTILMRCDDFVFYNSKAVFVEYVDIIRSPYFALLHSITSTGSDNETSVFDFSSMRNAGVDKLSDYYYHRRNQNFLYDFVKEGVMVDYASIDKLLDQQITDITLEYSTKLNFFDVIKNLMYTDSLLAKNVYIYYPYDNKSVKDDVSSIFDFNTDIQFVSGSLEDALQDVPTDSTYVFSDISHIETLASLDRLNFASILLPMEYGYNYTEPSDIESPLLIDIEKYMEEYTFKFDMFLASVEMPGASEKTGDE